MLHSVMIKLEPEFSVCVPGCDCRYAQYVERQAGDANDLIPPLPPLTRFKRELAIRAEQSDSSPHSGYNGR